MTSIVGYTPTAGVADAVPIWFKLDWSPEIEHDIYRDWGTYYFNRRRENMAMHYYNKALEIDPYDYMTLYRRSQTQRKAAKIEGALNDAMQAAEIAMPKQGPNCPINLQICDALFELNRFELSNYEMHNNERVFEGVKVNTFKKRRVVVEDIIKDVTGKALSLFYLKNQKMVQHVSEVFKAKDFVDTRPLGKILLEQGKCDVVSIPEVDEVLLSPLEHARRNRAFNVIHQTYLNDSWYDVLFMKALRKNPSLLLNQCKRSKTFLSTLSVKQYEIVRQFMKMLQSRSPLYYVSFMKYKNKKMQEKNKEAFLFRIQYQTHRNMIADLRQIRKLRKEKRVKSLSKYVEKVMGDYYVTKTNRLMCWKFEFLNEVYNTLALALAEQYHVPKNFKYSSSSMLQLMLLPMDKLKDVVPFVFGDRSTYQDGDVQDPVALNARKLLTRLEGRIRFAKYSIEKCYLFHQIASVHLTQGRYDECCFNARKSIKESRNCNSTIWNFLSVVQMIKANTMQHKVERTAEALEMAIPIAKQLNSPALIKFMDLCVQCNEEAFAKKLSSIATSRRSSKGSALAGRSEENFSESDI